MKTKLEKEVRFLKNYAMFATLVFMVLLFSAFAFNNKKFKEIDVERINVLEKDGRLKMVISNSERQHPGSVDGKTIPRDSSRPAGMIFFNERGDEVGGLVFSGNTGEGQFGSLTFDKFRGDQTIAFQHLENKEGRYFAGLSFNDENITTPERTARFEAIKKLPTEEARNEAFQKMKENGEFLVNRMAIGKGRNKASIISMSDAKGKERILISVSDEGNPKIDFKDEAGKVIYSLPEEKKPAN